MMQNFEFWCWSRSARGWDAVCFAFPQVYGSRVSVMFPSSMVGYCCDTGL